MQIFMFSYFNVRLLDYSILLKAKQDELIHELITLHNHEFTIQQLLPIH